MRRSVDQTTKMVLILLVVVLSYAVLTILVTPIFVQQPKTMDEMMQRMMNFSQQNATPNLVALVLALGIGVAISLRLRTLPAAMPRSKNSRQQALAIVRKKLSGDEKKIINEIERADVITQDSLRARLGWSKAKVSTTLTRLDRMNLIQRERQGKTYNVFLSKDLR